MRFTTMLFILKHERLYPIGAPLSSPVRRVWGQQIGTSARILRGQTNQAGWAHDL